MFSCTSLHSSGRTRQPAPIQLIIPHHSIEALHVLLLFQSPQPNGQERWDPHFRLDGTAHVQLRSSRSPSSLVRFSIRPSIPSTMSFFQGGSVTTDHDGQPISSRVEEDRFGALLTWSIEGNPEHPGGPPRVPSLVGADDPHRAVVDPLQSP